MSNEDTKPTTTRVGTLEIAMELKDLSAVLAGLEQIKVAAHEAAAAVASIGAVTPGTPKDVASLAREWLVDIERGSDMYGMPPLSPKALISRLSRIAEA